MESSNFIVASLGEKDGVSGDGESVVGTVFIISFDISFDSGRSHDTFGVHTCSLFWKRGLEGMLGEICKIDS